MKGQLHAHAILSLERARWYFVPFLPIVIYSLVLILDYLVLFRNYCLPILSLQFFVFFPFLSFFFLFVFLPSFLSQNIHFCVLMSRPTCGGITRLTNWIFSWACHVNERKEWNTYPSCCIKRGKQFVYRLENLCGLCLCMKGPQVVKRMCVHSSSGKWGSLARYTHMALWSHIRCRPVMSCDMNQYRRCFDTQSELTNYIYIYIYIYMYI